jgi:hypothetical protein
LFQYFAINLEQGFGSHGFARAAQPLSNFTDLCQLPMIGSGNHNQQAHVTSLNLYGVESPFWIVYHVIKS